MSMNVYMHTPCARARANMSMLRPPRAQPCIVCPMHPRKWRYVVETRRVMCLSPEFAHVMQGMITEGNLDCGRAQVTSTLNCVSSLLWLRPALIVGAYHVIDRVACIVCTVPIPSLLRLRWV